MKCVYGFVASLALAVITAPALCQEKPPAAVQKPPAPAPERAMPPVSESVDVSVTSVDVFVTDSKGQRVPGLTAKDFEVRQDGIPQAITNFYAVTGGKILFEDGTTVPLDVKEAAPEVPQEVKAHYVFYIDNLNIQPMNRNRMFKRLKEFVPQAIGPNAEGMVVTFNRSVKIRKGFTTDAAEIVSTLDQIELDTGGGTTLQGERRDVLDRINAAKSSAEAQGAARTYAQALRNDLEFTTDALEATVNGLAGLQGRKNFVYVSEGLPSQAGLELYEAIREKFQDASVTITGMEFDMNTKYLKIVQAANANGVTIYSLDAAGLTTPDLMTAENRGTSVQLNDFVVRQNMQAPIKMFAEETGGIYSVNTNDWKMSLDEIAADFSNFYSLGYRSAKGASDRPHRIEVTVKKKGLTVRTRTSYVEKSMETPNRRGGAGEPPLPAYRQPAAGQRVRRRAQALRRRELPAARACRGADRQARPRSLGRPLRRAVLRVLRGARRLRQAVGPADPEAAGVGPEQGSLDGAAQGLLLRREAHRRPGRTEAGHRRARCRVEPDVLRAEERLRVGAPQGEADRPAQAGDLTGG